VTKHLLLGVWMCLVSLGAAYGGILWQAHQNAPSGNGEKPKLEIQQVQTKRISVPIIDDGVVKGYVFAQFVFQVDAAAMKEMTVKPDIFLVDEAFKVIYRGEGINLRNAQKTDIAKLSATIKKNVNARIGENFVQDVLVTELNYISKDGIRGGALLGGPHFG
jgi:hypothetical protein